MDARDALKRNVSSVATTLIVLASSFSMAGASNEVQGGYSTGPLKNPVFDSAKVAVETAAFNNWLNGNYASLCPMSGSAGLVTRIDHPPGLGT